MAPILENPPILPAGTDPAVVALRDYLQRLVFQLNENNQMIASPGSKPNITR